MVIQISHDYPEDPCEQSERVWVDCTDSNECRRCDGDAVVDWMLVLRSKDRILFILVMYFVVDVELLRVGEAMRPVESELMHNGEGDIIKKKSPVGWPITYLERHVISQDVILGSGEQRYNDKKIKGEQNATSPGELPKRIPDFLMWRAPRPWFL